MNTNNDNQLITNREAEALLKVTRNTLWRWRREGKLKCVCFGTRKVLFRLTDIQELINSNLQ